MEELPQIQLVEVALPARQGITIRKRGISPPTEHQANRLRRPALHLPPRPKISAVQWKNRDAGDENKLFIRQTVDLGLANSSTLDIRKRSGSLTT